MVLHFFFLFITLGKCVPFIVHRSKVANDGIHDATLKVIKFDGITKVIWIRCIFIVWEKVFRSFALNLSSVRFVWNWSVRNYFDDKPNDQFSQFGVKKNSLLFDTTNAYLPLRKLTFFFSAFSSAMDSDKKNAFLSCRFKLVCGTRDEYAMNEQKGKSFFVVEWKSMCNSIVHGSRLMVHSDAWRAVLFFLWLTLACFVIFFWFRTQFVTMRATTSAVDAIVTQRSMT